MNRLISPLLAAALLALPAHADEVSDTIESALSAYKDGRAQDALDDLAYAQQLLREKKADSLGGFLPAAPAGWTRTVKTDMNAGLAMMGGGVGAEATYEKDGDRFTITLMADNPMVASMGAMLNNSALMAQMGKITRVGRQRFLNQDGDLSALIGNRVLVQAKGADPSVMVPVLQAIDFNALANFNS